MLVPNNDPILQLMREGCRKGIFPGMVLCVSREGSTRYDHAVGNARLEPDPIPMVSEALFDVASLTKPMATTAAIMVLIQSNELSLDDPIARYFPSFQREDKKDITVRHLLSHCSGLPAHICFYEELEALRKEGEGPSWGTESMSWLVKRIAGVECQAPGTQAVYSDLGFMMLGQLVVEVSQQSLDQFCMEQIFLPLGMGDTFFLPLYDEVLCRSRVRGRQVVSTENCPWRGRVLVGEVHDDNCFSLGGVCGHAGLFSTAADVHRFVMALFRCSKGAGSFLSAELVQKFWEVQGLVEGSTWALGWDSPSLEGSQAGDHFSASSVGHLGFTGCSIWLDREEEVVVVMCTNRVHPSRDNDGIKRFRPLLHNMVRTMIAKPVPLPPPRRMGAAPDVMTEEEAELLLKPSGGRLHPPSLKSVSSKEKGSGGDKKDRYGELVEEEDETLLEEKKVESGQAVEKSVEEEKKVELKGPPTKPRLRPPPKKGGGGV